MNIAKSVIITANSKQSVLLYRSKLIRDLREQKLEVKIVSNFTAIFWFFIKLRNKPIFISSDGRSNLLMLLLCWLNGMIILNGLGRYEKSKLVRICIINLLKIRKNVTCVAQSYRDYRYFAKYIGRRKVIWIPGSGGIKRITKQGKNKQALLVSRDSKFDFIKNVILGNKFKLDIDIIGLSKTWSEEGVQSLGRVPQENLFANHNKFLQLYYYGEGTPHTLVDAFSSSMEIYIDKKSFQNFGIYKYANAEPYNANLLILKPHTDGYKAYQNLTSSKNVLPIYIGEILIQLKHLASNHAFK